MDELVNSFSKNKRTCFIVLAAAMIVVFGVCPAINIFGKATATGFKVLFDAEGLGFPRFLSFLMFVSPLIILIKQFVDFNVKGNLKENLEIICFAVSVFLFIMFAVTLPDGVSATVGAYLYLALSVLGAVCCYLSKSQKKA